MYRMLLSLTVCICLSTAAYHKTTLLQFDPQPHLKQNIEQFLSPVTFTQNGFADFFTHQYNTRRYAHEFLPCCFIHVLDFLSHARTTPAPQEFAISAFDLFHQRLKDSTWVNPYALIMLLEHIPDTLISLCAADDRYTTYRQILHDALLYDFGTLQEDPDRFLDITAQRLVGQEETHQTTHQLKERTTRFIESALDKLIWSPNEQASTWRTCCTIGRQLEQLYQYHIIPDETQLNHLLWSLVYRFSYFLDYAGRYISEDTYTTIRKELEDENTQFLDYEELESYITDKRTFLLDTLARGYVRSRARREGMSY